MNIWTWINGHLPQLTALVMVAILLTVGRAKLLPGVKQNKALLWLAWLVTVVCGLILGYALYGVVGWITSLGGTLGGIVGSLGAVVAMWLGWHAAYLLVALIRDLADGTPDDDARKAALWVPTMLPAGFAAVWGVVSHPRGVGTGLVAAVMAGITVVYAHRIVKAALSGKSGRRAWRWFAALVMLLAGIVMIPLLAYVDDRAATVLPGPWLVASRVVLGTAGVALLIGAMVDIKDKVPDAAVRAFLAYGVPVLFLFGALALSAVQDHSGTGLTQMTGSMR